MDAVTANSETDDDESKDLLLEKLESRDVLIEILILLPPESIFSLMCVSKRWIAILTDSLFLRCYSAAARRRSGGAHVVAFFQKLTNSNLNVPGKHCNTLPISIPNRNLIEAVPKKFGYFINSSNGLILCSHEHRRSLYHVINPVTRKYKSLPPPRNNNLPMSTGLICEENTTKLAPIYTVVRAGLHLLPYKYNIMYIDTYSSITGVWSDPRILTAREPFLLLRRPPVVANGVLHWYSTDWRLAVYDPKDVESHIQLIQLPLFGLTYSNAVTRSGVDGSLWYGGIGSCCKMKFFVLPKREGDSYRCVDREEWMLIYDISLVSLGNLTISAVLESIISPLNSQMEMVAVLRYRSDVFYFNLETSSTEEVNYHAPHSPDQDNHLFPYIHSSYLSSYARIF